MLIRCNFAEVRGSKRETKMALKTPFVPGGSHFYFDNFKCTLSVFGMTEAHRDSKRVDLHVMSHDLIT